MARKPKPKPGSASAAEAQKNRVNAYDSNGNTIEVNEAVKVFIGLRKELERVKDEYLQPWTWHPFLKDTMDVTQEHILNITRELSDVTSSLDNCYYLISVYPQRYDEMIGALADMGEDTDAMGGNLGQLCDTLKHKLDVLRSDHKDLQEELEETIEEWTEKYNNKVNELTQMTEDYNREYALRNVRDDELAVCRKELADERAENERLRAKIENLEADIVKRQEEKEIRAVKAGAVLLPKAEKIWLLNMFLCFRQYCKTEQLKRMSEVGATAFHDRIEDLEKERNFLFLKIEGLESDIEYWVNKHDILVEERVERARMILSKYNSHIRLDYMKRALREWYEHVPLFKMDRKIEELTDSLKNMTEKFEYTDKEWKKEIRVRKNLRIEFDDFIEFKKQERLNSLVGYAGHVIKLRVAQIQLLKSTKREAKLLLLQEVDIREKKITYLESMMKGGTAINQLKAEKAELAWQLEMTTKGPPTKVIATDASKLCTACGRQVLYQNYVETKHPANRRNMDWKLPLVFKNSQQTLEKIESPPVRAIRIWQP